MIVDAHQHFWKYNRQTHAWINEEMAIIRKDFGPEELAPIYAENAIDACVVVQADQTLEETDFLLKLSDENDFIKGVVGWVDLRAANINEVLSAYGNKDKLKGFRHIVQGETDPEFLLKPAFLNGIKALANNDYTYDLLVFPHQLEASIAFVKKFPNQKFVIDHIAKPNIKEGLFEEWSQHMQKIAQFPNVSCKLSGMITETDYQQWTPAQIEPYMQWVLDIFGTNRLMYGSDWPVCLVAGNYAQVKMLVKNFISTLSTTEQAHIMGGNAIKFYNL